MKENIEIVPPQREKTPEERAQDFIQEYNNLCRKHQLMLAPTPILWLQDNNTWSIRINMNVQQLDTPQMV